MMYKPVPEEKKYWNTLGYMELLQEMIESDCLE